MRTQQRGITAIGWLILLIPTAVVGYAAIRLTPVYLNYMKVARTLERLPTEITAPEGITSQTIRTTIGKHFDIESVQYPDVKDIKVSRDGKSWLVEAVYDDQAPLFSNLSILVTFDKSVRLGNVAD